MPDFVAVPDFRLYHSNSLEVLAGLLAAQLRQPVPGQAVLSADMVLIPQVAMRRWLQATLAAEHGIAANLEFLTPGEFVSRALQANVPGEHQDLDAASLCWRVYAALTDPTWLRMPALAALRTYLADEDPLKAWALAGELASVFEKYQAWRRDWLLRWEAGADPQDPQALLWRRIASGRNHRARRIQHYLARFAGEGLARPAGLPPRLFVFATLNISPDVLRVIATQARVGTTHFYLPTPTRTYWGDMQTLAQKLRSGHAEPFGQTLDDNRLLQAWGAAGRDFMAVLGSYEVVHPAGEIAAYADPEEQTPPALDPGSERLLHHMQRDLLHRRAQPSAPVRTQVDRHDPSLQIHACHTRMREVQVLHDQLRGLLEDSRFDPPLQPREIAVLAPDVDPYVPYLHAVFGGQGHAETLPWTLADTSPLASEPLAEVFLRLLELPVSRFGLDEILDLLSSAPIAEASGLEAQTLDRLHVYLSQSGVRWGLDAAHRVAAMAPDDDAYTWQFALDRLLLGHASGAEEEIAGVAPWPELEGSALEGLDTLIGLLRELARQRRDLALPQSPAHWRERLLRLLDTLLPQRPMQARGQRALERLRTLIDGFARDAASADYSDKVPADVVRAYFAQHLSQADTRAPLLTGGISVGRMVPMRLLPFRVICLLGMNDGDFPRSDPASDLNRLTAELGTDRQRPGDRSTREDDRFLFLQLLVAAQDVFYLSYLGTDPREGSQREPSVLISELLDAAADYHTDPQARHALTVQHSLQPFAPAAFGDAQEPRRFSYRASWQPGAQRLSGPRQDLPPWWQHALPEPATQPDTLSLDTLRRFFIDPQGQFLAQRLGLRLPDPIQANEDLEPLVLPERGLSRSRLQQAVLEAQQTGHANNDLYARLRARALLPSGALAQRQFNALQAHIRPFAQARADWLAGEAVCSQRYEVVLDGLRLQGRIEQVHPRGLLRVRPQTLNGPSALRWGLDWLLANAAGAGLPLVQFHDGPDGPGPYIVDAPDAAQARHALRQLLALYADGLREPLWFAPYTGWEIWTTPPEQRRAAAWKRWHGDTQGGWAESSGAAIALTLRGRDPFANPQDYLLLEHTSLHIYGLVRQATVPPDATDATTGEAP